MCGSVTESSKTSFVKYYWKCTAMVDLPKGPFFHFDVQKFRNVTTSGVLRDPRPPYGKSWIRHCYNLYFGHFNRITDRSQKCL